MQHYTIHESTIQNDWIRKPVNSLQRTATAANIEIGRKCSKGQNVIENEYLNLFGLIDECGKRKLFHLSSGIPLQDEIADEILHTFCEGQSLYELFRKERLLSCEKLFLATLQKNNFMPFSKVSANYTIKSRRKNENRRSKLEYIKRT